MLTKACWFVLLVLACVSSPLFAQSQANPASKLAWEVAGQDATVANSATYNLYVDVGTPVPLSGVVCAFSPVGTSCEASIPAMTPGPHTLTLTQVIAGAESAKSNPVAITFVVVVTPEHLRVK